MSDLAQIFLPPLEIADRADTAYTLRRPTPRRILVARAEAQAHEWARFWFNPQEVKDWLAHHPRIQPYVAAALRDAGITPHQATANTRTPRGFVHRLPIAIRVAAGDITAQEAAAELQGMNPS
ncbi:hypothetical protein [Catellatospora chokoriensis]|uniref:hypothetical protein n=1 Tax=Catellatospora chokoriensis TaxID=310353 RepID=UPI00177DB050|nr:hypothetical protein [Catellatospora chokoriensis]